MENGTMQIQIVNDNKTAQQWLDAPAKVYAHDRNYIPHIRQDISGIFDPAKNKLFSQGSAKRWILIDSQNEVVGRVAAFFSKKYSDAQKQKTGGIGFFECIHDGQASHLLLDAACQWLWDSGVDAIDGPINFGENVTKFFAKSL